MTVKLGQEAVLSCSVISKGDFKVGWIKVSGVGGHQEHLGHRSGCGDGGGGNSVGVLMVRITNTLCPGWRPGNPQPAQDRHHPERPGQPDLRRAQHLESSHQVSRPSNQPG